MKKSNENKRNIRSNLKKQLWKVAFARNSIHSAKLACDFIIKNSKFIDNGTYQALTTGITILYARPFGSNRGVGTLPAKFMRFKDDRLQKAHNLLIAARHKFFAHTDAECKYNDEHGQEKEELLKIEIVVGPLGADGKAEAQACIYLPILSRDYIPLIKALFEDLLRKLEEKEKAILTKLSSDKGLKVGSNPVNIFDES